jgi:hypothetical protein
MRPARAGVKLGRGDVEAPSEMSLGYVHQDERLAYLRELEERRASIVLGR